jgi:5-methylcytosine-specific restriction endonuclease McrA
MTTLVIRLGSTYGQRGKTLLALGYPSYQLYLESELWAGIRKRVIERDGQLCRVCKFLAKEVHHTDYLEDTLTGANLDHMLSLCARCHHKIEFHGDWKRTMEQANLELVKLLEKPRDKKKQKPQKRSEPETQKVGAWVIQKRLCIKCGGTLFKKDKSGVCKVCRTFQAGRQGRIRKARRR